MGKSCFWLKISRLLLTIIKYPGIIVKLRILNLLWSPVWLVVLSSLAPTKPFPTYTQMAGQHPTTQTYFLNRGRHVTISLWSIDHTDQPIHCCSPPSLNTVYISFIFHFGFSSLLVLLMSCSSISHPHFSILLHLLLVLYPPFLPLPPIFLCGRIVCVHWWRLLRCGWNIALKSWKLLGWCKKKILAGLKTVDSIDCVNVEHHWMSISKITMH